MKGKIRSLTHFAGHSHPPAMLFGDASYHRERIATLLKARVESGAGVF